MFGYIVTGIVGLILAWIGVGAVSEHGVKEPSFVVEVEADGYEVRRYEPYLVAEAEVPSKTDDSLGTGFRMLFKYIGGANQGSRKMDMTAPVIREEAAGESITMTKPVLRQQERRGTRVAFVLPAGYSLQTAPRPENQSIHIREISSRRVAVLRFSGYATDPIVDKKRKQLASMLSRDGLSPAGAFLTAYYNPPWTPPFMRRNEVMVEIK